MPGLDADILDATLDAIREFSERLLPVERQLQLDHEDECPVDMVRAMCGDELGVQLLFIPEEFGGMGGGTFDVYRVCEAMARIDLGVATRVQRLTRRKSGSPRSLKRGRCWRTARPSPRPAVTWEP
jgi:alkylation response protein AidB-like acyl-CoA dehydrogenase